MKAKRGAAMLCAACLIWTGAAALPAPAAVCAAEEEAAPVFEGLRYEITDGAVTITGVTEDLEGEVTVPAEIEKLPVTKIGAGAFQFNTKITAVTLPESVTEIGAAAFKSCFVLKTVTLPSGLTEIADNTFLKSRKLESIAVPEHVKHIGEMAFANCDSLADLTLPEGLETVGADAFLYTPWMYAQREKNPFVVINHVLIDGKACSGDITLPSDITVIGEGAFAYNHDIINVLIPETVKEIRAYGIFDCNRLESVTILNPDCEIYDMKATISNNYARHEPFMLGTIRGFENAAAQAYCEKYEYPYEVLKAVKGDLDLNGKVSAEDAQSALNYYVKSIAGKNPELNDLQKGGADVNGDGAIDSADAQLILLYYVKNTIANHPTAWEALTAESETESE